MAFIMSFWAMIFSGVQSIFSLIPSVAHPLLSVTWMWPFCDGHWALLQIDPSVLWLGGMGRRIILPPEGNCKRGWGTRLLSFLPKESDSQKNDPPIAHTVLLSESQIYTLLSKETLSEKKGFTLALRFIPDILELSQSLRMSYWLKSELRSAGERLI